MVPTDAAEGHNLLFRERERRARPGGAVTADGQVRCRMCGSARAFRWAIEREAGEHGDTAGPGWIRIDEQLHREFTARGRALSAMVEGRTVYEMMDPLWPDARSDESLPSYLREFGEIWTAMPKVMVSR